MKVEQEKDLELQFIVKSLGTDQAKDFTRCKNDILRFRGIVCILEKSKIMKVDSGGRT